MTWRPYGPRLQTKSVVWRPAHRRHRVTGGTGRLPLGAGDGGPVAFLPHSAWPWPAASPQRGSEPCAGRGCGGKPGPETSRAQARPGQPLGASLSERITEEPFYLPPRLTNRTSRSAGIILGPGSSTLFIERVTEEDEGVYHCKATNQKGSAESWARLTVQGKCGGAAGPPSPVCFAFHLRVPCCPSSLCLPLASCPSPVLLGRAQVETGWPSSGAAIPTVPGGGREESQPPA